MALSDQSGDGEVGDDESDVAGRGGAVRRKPESGPVERAEERARGDGRVGRDQDALADAGGNQRADAALVLVALRDDPGAQSWRQGVEFHMGGGAADLVDKAQDVGHGEVAQALGERSPGAAGGTHCFEEAVERAVLAEVQEFVLAAKVVVQIAGGEIRGEGDVAHARCGKAALPKHRRGGFEDAQSARVRAD
jgi:hypothetical protein